jgi:hypothetical protein
MHALKRSITYHNELRLLQWCRNARLARKGVSSSVTLVVIALVTRGQRWVVVDTQQGR